MTLITPKPKKFWSVAPIWGKAAAGVSYPGGVEAQAFMARTSGLDTTHQNAYAALIDGLVADGVWSKLDMLHVYATQDSTTAVLNLVSSSYTGIANGSPVFTADRGFTGQSISTKYINTQFNPTTASSPKFVQNSAHQSIWNVGNVTGGSPCMGADNGTTSTILSARLGDGNAYFRTNMTAAGGSDTATNAAAAGHYIGTRTASNVMMGYKNGATLLTSANVSTALINLNMYTLAQNGSGTASGAINQLAMASIGSGLTATDATNFYNRLRTYMTSVGVP